MDLDDTSDGRDSGRTAHIQSSNLETYPYAGDLGQLPVCCTLSDSDTYLLLTKHFKPEYTYKFPGVPDNHGINRSFQWSWLQAFPGLVYSPSLNGGFYKHCALFGKVHVSHSVS